MRQCRVLNMCANDSECIGCYYVLVTAASAPGRALCPPLHMHWLVPVLVLVGMYLYSRVLALLVVHKYIC